MKNINIRIKGLNQYIDWVGKGFVLRENRPTVPRRPCRAFSDGHQGRAHRAFSDGPHRGKQNGSSTASNCALASIEHSQMDTRVGPIEHSQMDPTEASKCIKCTTHNGICAGSPLQAFAKIWRVFWCGESENMGRGQIVHCTSIIVHCT